ncbi:hypothetical protein BDP81DRAFT_62050 [Colletotrichum phormii]|uniref:Secreted protein n=1 Tax=Colletotrichum phormii TaxID=359342 RepID=A0AAJ0EE86_9PEZI|nr:uncharacterized protein BDP81DRAFT_62050 [Colletotrichum phormii]KAK1633851.1 hypothetical protein BDP81DRAFT_62050 [Colletotrichum phormii]
MLLRKLPVSWCLFVALSFESRTICLDCCPVAALASRAQADKQPCRRCHQSRFKPNRSLDGPSRSAASPHQKANPIHGRERTKRTKSLDHRLRPFHPPTHLGTHFVIPHWRNKRTNPTTFIPFSSFGNAFSHAIQANQSRGLVLSIEMHFRSSQICRVQSRPVFPFRLVVSFSPGPVKSRRPDEPGHPFQPTATSLRTLLRRQPFPYPRRLHNCQETCPGLPVRTGLPHDVQFDRLRLCPLSPQLLVGNDIPSNVLSLSQPLRNKRATKWVHRATKPMSAAATS